jgi:hypothetical protein
MKVLFVSDHNIFTKKGGAELNLLTCYNNAPKDVQVEFSLPQDLSTNYIQDFDIAVIANVRFMSPDEAIKMMNKFLLTNVPYVKSEHDVMFDNNRLGQHVMITNDFVVAPTANYEEHVWYKTTQELFSNAIAVRFLSPLQHNLFRSVGINFKKYFLAGSWIDRTIFKNKKHKMKRTGSALTRSGYARGDNMAKFMADKNGHHLDTWNKTNATPQEMADLYNNYRYYYEYPEFFSTYGRGILEAEACGLEIFIPKNHALLSYGSMEKAIQSSVNAIDDFWNNIINLL